jgi:hypothetical protein
MNVFLGTAIYPVHRTAKKDLFKKQQNNQVSNLGNVERIKPLYLYRNHYPILQKLIVVVRAHTSFTQKNHRFEPNVPLFLTIFAFLTLK